MQDFTEMSSRAFVAALASKSAVPGGGGASALVGAIGMALGHMVGSLTVGKKKYAAVEPEIVVLMEKAAKLQNILLDLIQKDAEAFEPLSRAYGMPAETAEQKTAKQQVMELALVTAAQAPLEIMRTCGAAIEVTAEFEAKGSVLAVSDAGVAATMLRSALTGAYMNVIINTKMMQNRQCAEKLNGEAQKLLQGYQQQADTIVANVVNRLA